MAKIDENFPYDVYKFLIQGIRDADADRVLERWLLGVQAEFERTHGKILELRELVLPLTVDEEILPFLAWIVGFTNDPELAWAADLDTTTLRKLVKNAVSLWKTKGTRANLLNFLRAFTGRRAILRDWFFHRILIGEEGGDEEPIDLFCGGVEGDPWIYGGKYSPLDEFLTFVLINRAGITENEKRLIYELFTYIHPVSAHFGIVYCAFVDNFAEGLGQWVDESSGVVATVEDGLVVFGGTSGTDRVILRTDLPPEETVQWEKIFSWFSIRFDGNGEFTINLRRDGGAIGSGYSATLAGSGDWSLNHSDLGEIDSGVHAMPEAFTPILFELVVEPLNAGETRLRVLIEHTEVSSFTLTGEEIFEDISGGCTIYGGLESEGTFLEFAQILATPLHVQYVGQASTKETGYIAVPDPGLEPFVPTPVTS